MPRLAPVLSRSRIKMPAKGRMTLDPNEPHTQSLVQNATAMAQAPWGWSRIDLQRSQRILLAAGYKALADSLQPFIDEPALPLRKR